MWYLKEAISLLEEETILDELGLDFLGHASQWVVSSLEFAFQGGQAGDDFLFHLLVVGLSQARVEGIAGQGSAATDAGGDDEGALEKCQNQTVKHYRLTFNMLKR